MDVLLLIVLLLLAVVGGAGGAVGLLYTFDVAPKQIAQRPAAGEVWHLHGWGDVDVWGVYATELLSERQNPLIAVVPMGQTALHWMRLTDFQKRARPIPFDALRNEHFTERRDRMRQRWRRGR